MGSKIYEISSSLEGDEYQALIEVASARGLLGLLVQRPNLGLSSAGKKLLLDLGPFVEYRKSTSTWPGTSLLEGSAELAVFRLDSAVIALLLGAANGVFEWAQPELPEDLGFVDQSGRAWFASVAHERAAFIDLSPWDLQQLRHHASSFRFAEASGVADLGRAF